MPLVESHCSFLLPYILLKPTNFLLDDCLALVRTSISKASALASDHAAVCYLLFRALAQLQHPYLARPPSALNVDPPCAQRPFKIALRDRGAESDRVPPSPSRHPTPQTLTPPPQKSKSSISFRQKVFDQAPSFTPWRNVNVPILIDQAPHLTQKPRAPTNPDREP